MRGLLSVDLDKYVYCAAAGVEVLQADEGFGWRYVRYNHNVLARISKEDSDYSLLFIFSESQR